jgi:hypothetical protein
MRAYICVGNGGRGAILLSEKIMCLRIRVEGHEHRSRVLIFCVGIGRDRSPLRLREWVLPKVVRDIPKFSKFSEIVMIFFFVNFRKNSRKSLEKDIFSCLLPNYNE